MKQNVLDSIDPRVIGERLAEARRARGLNQQQVAMELGVARTTVTAIETGVRTARASELLQFAQLYGRQVGDFVRQVQLTSSPGFLVQFRSARGPMHDVPENERDADILRFEELCRWYVELEELLGTPLPRRYPEPYDISGVPPERGAEEVAASERNRLGLGDGPIGDLWAVLESDVGLRIFSMPMASGRIAGMFLYSDEFGGCIAVNANHPEEKRRWTVAHDYAHFLTERYRPEIAVLSSITSVRESERFADSFARFFLIPTSGLTRRFQAMRRAREKPITPADVLSLCHHYNVSFQAMIWRLEELKLLPGGTWEKLKTLGFQVGNARKLTDLPPNSPGRSLFPPRYEFLAAQAFNAGLLSEGQLARRLASDRGAALLRVRELSEDRQPSDDGNWQQIPLDLNAALVATS